MSEQAAAGKVTAQTASRGVLVQLALFSLALGVVPITSYFASLKYFWNGNATYAAITAVFAANIVLVTYIIASLLEDRQGAGTSSRAGSSEARKER